MKNYQIKIMSKKEMRNFIKSLQKVIVNLVILGHFDSLGFKVFYQTNMHHTHFEDMVPMEQVFVYCKPYRNQHL